MMWAPLLGVVRRFRPEGEMTVKSDPGGASAKTLEARRTKRIMDFTKVIFFSMPCANGA
jgi:hypothetical protein